MNIKRHWSSAMCAVGVLVAVHSADAQTGWIQWPSSGHWYKAVLRSSPNDQAVADATANGAYLATIGSAAENAFAFDLINRAAFWYDAVPYNFSVGPWLGGAQAPGGAEPAGGWGWMTGEPFTFTAWAPGEPNDAASTNPPHLEDRLIFGASFYGRAATWHDAIRGNSTRGYILERNTLPPSMLFEQWSVNGHWYRVVPAPQGITWDDASAAAQTMDGYLATPTTAAENAFVFALADSQGFWSTGTINQFGPWIGGWQPSGNTEPAGGWRWVTSEAWSFTNWVAGAPNNGGSCPTCPNNFESRLAFYGSTPTSREARWDDAGTAVRLKGYVVEADCIPVAQQPGSTSTCDGGAASFSVEVGRSGVIAYQWQWRPVGGEWQIASDGLIADLGVVTGAASSTLSLSQTVRGQGVREFRCMMTAACSVYSSAATLTVCACLSCAADFNEDGGVDGTDVNEFFASWENGQCDADVNSDGGVDGDDIQVFFAAWEAGGC